MAADHRDPPAHDDASTRAHRQLIGYLGILLSPLLVLFAASRPLPDLRAWPPMGSVSAYYYTAGVVAFVGVLSALAVFLFTYRGYRNRHQWKDRLLAVVAGFAALGVALFPTTAPAPEYVLPWWTEATRTIHYVSAATLFGSFILFSIWLFPKTYEGTHEGRPESAKDQTLAREKRTRNVVYYVCGAVMLVSVAWILWAGQTQRPIFWPETIALTGFAVSWLTKGRALESVASGVRALRGAPAPDQASART